MQVPGSSEPLRACGELVWLPKMKRGGTGVRSRALLFTARVDGREGQGVQLAAVSLDMLAGTIRLSGSAREPLNAGVYGYSRAGADPS